MKRYWWVNQGRTFKLASQLQCIWAPFTTKTNKKIFHWENMDQVKLDDVVFSYFKGHIVSYNIVKKTSYRAERPFQDQQPDAPWKNIGRRIDLIYNILEQPIKISKIKIEVHQFQRDLRIEKEALGKLVYNQAKDNNMANFTGNNDFFAHIQKIDQIEESIKFKLTEIENIKDKHNIPEDEIIDMNESLEKSESEENLSAKSE